MPLGTESRRKLNECHDDLRKLITAVSKGVDEGDLSYAGIKDISVTCGFRDKAEQDEAVRTGASKSPWPTSKHNRFPSDAVDVVPFPELWSDTRKLEILHAYIAGVAHAQGVDLYDIDWDRPHIQRNVK
jgi:peptidoglycan L-alanyl-D-glutamate endopeptidase CwlK